MKASDDAPQRLMNIGTADATSTRSNPLQQPQRAWGTHLRDPLHMEGTMIDNSNIYKCECRVRGHAHTFTIDTSGKYVLLVDPDRAHLLRNVTWSVSPIHRKSKLLRARASTSAPRIKVGWQLHQLVMRSRTKSKRLWAVSRSYLDCRRANLRFVSHADVRILTTSRPSTQAVGVARPPQPKFFLTLLRPFHARISVGGTTLDLAWWATLEEAQCAYDAAAMMTHGPSASTNLSLGLLAPEVAKTKACKLAAKTARRIVREHRSGELAKRYEALKKAKTYAEKAKIWAGVRAVGQPLPRPRVVASNVAPS
jgi:hypothetical protein